MELPWWRVYGCRALPCRTLGPQRTRPNKNSIDLGVSSFRSMVLANSLVRGRAPLRDSSALAQTPNTRSRVVRLGRLLRCTQHWLALVSRMKLEPPLPCAVSSLLPVDAHDVARVPVFDFCRVFANEFSGGQMMLGRIQHLGAPGMSSRNGRFRRL